MLLHYDDEPAPARPGAADIWRQCLRQMIAWTVFYAVLAAAVIVMGALGLLEWDLTIT